MKAKKKALGKGLDAILSSPETDITSKDISGNYVIGAIANISISKIEVNPFQPRGNFSETSLKELTDSIIEQGIIQPITVRKLGFDKYQLISGERRYRASKNAGLKEIPTYIRVANDEQMLEMALVENIHRENLNSIEIAISYQRLIEECNLSQQKLSERVGKNRTTVSNYIRLLKLPAEIQIAIRDCELSMGHARAIINIDDEKLQLVLLKKILSEDLSVRKVESIVRELVSNAPTKKKPTINSLPEKYIKSKEILNNKFNTKIELIRNNKGEGKIVFNFKSDEELDKILSAIES
jgi:ParB family chromosome partitioning protein